MSVALDAEAVSAWLERGNGRVLLDVLPPAEHAAMTLPGAVNACVYEVAFLDHVRALAPEFATPLVVFGAGPDTRECALACERLRAAGYTDVWPFPGGRAAWAEAGYAFAGAAAQDTWRTVDVAVLPDGLTTLDTSKSVVRWVGRNVANRHFGTIGVRGGELRVEAGKLVAGRVILDMAAIGVDDLDGDAAKGLVGHLASEDFFDTPNHPTAELEIMAAECDDTPADEGAPNYRVTANLTLRGKTNEIRFAATVLPRGGGVFAAEAHFDIDRTRWNIWYGSARFFRRLGMHLVQDAISLDVSLVTVAREGPALG